MEWKSVFPAESWSFEKPTGKTNVLISLNTYSSVSGTRKSTRDTPSPACEWGSLAQIKKMKDTGVSEWPGRRRDDDSNGAIENSAAGRQGQKEEDRLKRMSGCTQIAPAKNQVDSNDRR
jgi:hypothetical protein